MFDDGGDIGALGFLFSIPEWKLVHRLGGQCIDCCTNAVSF